MKLFDNSGVFFRYSGDIILWRWPWAREFNSNSYHSSYLTRDFNNFKEYWTMFGEDRALIKHTNNSGKIQGFDLMEELVPQWSGRIWPNEHLVCLSNIHIDANGPKFWSMLNKAKRYELLKDVVVLRCKDKTEMLTLIDSIDPQFASALGVVNGYVISSNATAML